MSVVDLGLGAHARMTVSQALDLAKSRGLKEVLIIGTDEAGEIVIYSSHMARRDALWLAEQSRLHSLGISV